MTRRRRATIDRTPYNRAEMWDRKVEPSVYTIYLTRTKDMAFRKILYYQSIHEELIRIVKNTLSKYPDETSKQHAYMWYIQGLWYIKQRYSDKALQVEADALFIYFLFLGLKENILRELAQRLGICISTIDKLLERLGMSEEIVYRGTKKALQETLHTVEVNPVDVTFEYDPTTGNLIKIIKTDKVTGKKKIIHLEYDVEGNLIRKWEEYA